MRWPVDFYMEQNNERAAFMDSLVGEATTKPKNFFIPAMTIDEAVDFCGYDDDAEIGKVIVLPKDDGKVTEERARVAAYTRSHWYRATVLCECIHNNLKKENHHPDYDKPLEVMRLCKKCHSAEHKKLYRQEKQMIIAAIAIKMMIPRMNHRRPTP